MKFKIQSACFSALILLGYSLSFATGTERGGGDELGLNFQATAAQAIVKLQTHKLSQQDSAQLKFILEHARYIVVNEAQFVSLGGRPDIVQESAATNDKKAQIIYINRAKWLGITDVQLRRRMALHELLGLAGLESTGDYHISSTAILGDDQAIANAILVYRRFWDNPNEGLNADSVARACTLQKAIFKDQYAIVYCSFLEKHIVVQRKPQRVETAYGLSVWGISQRQMQNTWTTVFSSKEFLNDTLSMEFPSQSEAYEACSLELAESLESEPLWTGAQCFTEADHQQYFYEIRIPN